MTSLAHEQSLQAHIGYKFKSPDILQRALTHGSMGDGKAVADNERLEFLGDRVLGLIVAEFLFEEDQSQSEGQMARRLNALVRKEACAKAAMAANIGPALYLSKAEEKNGGREKLSILGDACEAVLAALYLDGGLDAAKNFFYRFWDEQLSDISSGVKDPKSTLQEWALSHGHELPKYKMLGRTGPDHRPEFQVEVLLGKFNAQGVAGSKQEAERLGAKALLVKIGVSVD